MVTQDPTLSPSVLTQAGTALAGATAHADIIGQSDPGSETFSNDQIAFEACNNSG
jgi:hypothetical protein